MEEFLSFENVWFSYDLDDETDDKVKDGKSKDTGIDKTQPIKKAVVKGVNLKINKGEFVAILGHNGSGKSTLAKLSNAILIPDKGRVRVNGIDTSDETRTMEIRQHIGMVFQNPDNQIVATIVEEDVAFGPENLGVNPIEIRSRVDKALCAVGMYEYRTHEPHKLSGGQKQRVAIAGILAMQPGCIVLDESTAMLDPRGRREVMKTVKKLHDEMGMTVVFITHFMDEAATAERVIVMDDGKILLDGPPAQVFSEVDVLRTVGLDVPQATEFSLELEKIGINMPKDILGVYDCVHALKRALEE